MAEQGFLNRLWQALATTPSAEAIKPVFRGASGVLNADPHTEEGAHVLNQMADRRGEWGANAGLAVGTGGLGGLGGRPANTLGMFGGKMAVTADRVALAQAEKMAAAGADKKAIWDKTGWFQGGDGKWRFEIDDSASKLGTINPEPQPTPMRVGLKHPELYKAYPDTIPVKVNEKTDMFTKGAKAEYVSDGPSGVPEINLHWANNPVDNHSGMLHELQHHIQAKEGFAGGFSAPGIKPGTAAWDAYLAAPGEVEARLVQARMNMTPEQRRMLPPWLDERGGLGGLGGR